MTAGPYAVCTVQDRSWDQGCLVTDCKRWSPPENVLFSEEEDRRGMDFFPSCAVCSNHSAQSTAMCLSERRGMVSCMQTLPQPNHPVGPQAAHQGTPTGQGSGFPSFSCPTTVLVLMARLCQRALTHDLAIRQLMRNRAEPGMATESCQQKQCLSEEADELWLQQMSHRCCVDMGSVLNIT